MFLVSQALSTTCQKAPQSSSQQSDVQKAINAPSQEWEECTNVNVFVNGTDTSPPSASASFQVLSSEASGRLLVMG